MQRASYPEGGPLMWMLPLYLHVNLKPVVVDDDDEPVHLSLPRCGNSNKYPKHMLLDVLNNNVPA